MKELVKKILYILSLDWIEEWKTEAVTAGALDLSGQGRDRYGK